MNIRGDENCDIITAEKRELQIFRSLLECFHIASRSTVEPNSVQIGIKYSENKYERIVELRAISGVRKLMLISY
jgi:hypothetical protein